jgi:hypothetical protein
MYVDFLPILIDDRGHSVSKKNRKKNIRFEVRTRLNDCVEFSCQRFKCLLLLTKWKWNSLLHWSGHDDRKQNAHW